MVNKIFTLLIAFFLYANLQAQVTEVTKDMSYGNRPGYKIVVKNAKEKEVAKLWEDYIKETYGAKTKKGKGGELVATGAKGGALGSSTGTIYSQVDQEGDDVVIHAWLDNGATFVSPSTDATAAAAATSSMAAFQLNARRSTLSNSVAAEEKELKKLTDNMEKLKRENENLKKDIESYKKKILDAESSLEKNTKNQEVLLNDMQTQQRKVDEARLRLMNVENEKN